MAQSLLIFACHIGVFRLGSSTTSTVSDVREELYHRPEAPTTTTYDVLTPAALLFNLLFANDITKLQPTTSANMPNGILCSSKHQRHSDNVPSSVEQHGATTQMSNIYVFAPHLFQDNPQDAVLPSSSNSATQMPNIHVSVSHLLPDISRDATYSPLHATVSTSSAQMQTTAAAGLVSSSVVHYGAPVSAAKHLENYYCHAAGYCFSIPILNGFISSSKVSNGTALLQNIDTAPVTNMHCSNGTAQALLQNVVTTPLHPFLSTTDVPHLSSNYAGIVQLSRTTTSDVHSLSAADAAA